MKITKKIITQIDEILGRGLSSGLGSRDGQMCVEAAICAALGEPHGDEPSCVSPAVRQFKIVLNDCKWSGPHARAAGMRSLAIAQLGSKGKIDDVKFSQLLSVKFTQQLIPMLFREIFTGESAEHKKCLEAAISCEKVNCGATSAAAGARAARAAARAAAEGAARATSAAAAGARAARAAEGAARATSAAAWAARAAARAAEEAARAAAWAAEGARAAAEGAKLDPDKYLLLGASICLEVLTELKSPGVKWLKNAPLQPKN